MAVSYARLPFLPIAISPTVADTGADPERMAPPTDNSEGGSDESPAQEPSDQNTGQSRQRGGRSFQGAPRLRDRLLGLILDFRKQGYWMQIHFYMVALYAAL